MLFDFSRHCTRSDLVPRRNPYTAMPVPHFTKNYSNNDKRHQTFKVFIEQNNKPIKKKYYFEYLMMEEIRFGLNFSSYVHKCSVLEIKALPHMKGWSLS